MSQWLQWICPYEDDVGTLVPGVIGLFWKTRLQTASLWIHGFSKKCYLLQKVMSQELLKTLPSWQAVCHSAQWCPSLASGGWTANKKFGTLWKGITNDVYFTCVASVCTEAWQSHSLLPGHAEKVSSHPLRRRKHQCLSYVVLGQLHELLKKQNKLMEMEQEHKR